MKYRTSDYFNNLDYYLILPVSNIPMITKLYKYNNNWYCTNGMGTKCTTIKMININELL